MARIIYSFLGSIKERCRALISQNEHYIATLLRGCEAFVENLVAKNLLSSHIFLYLWCHNDTPSTTMLCGE